MITQLIEYIQLFIILNASMTSMFMVGLVGLLVFIGYATVPNKL